jgi:hypothetical protein
MFHVEHFWREPSPRHVSRGTLLKGVESAACFTWNTLLITSSICFTWNVLKGLTLLNVSRGTRALSQAGDGSPATV